MELVLPIFPLQLVVFPEEKLNLHIFEPRYKELIKDVHKSKVNFVIPCYFNDKPLVFGTEVRLDEIVKIYDDGKMDVRTTGLYPVKISHIFKTMPKKLYAGAKVERQTFKGEADSEKQSRILESLEHLYAALRIKKKVPANDKLFQTFQVAHYVGFTYDQEYKFLQIPTEIERQDYLLKHITEMLPILNQMQALRERVKLNGHFKDLKPPIF